MTGERERKKVVTVTIRKLRSLSKKKDGNIWTSLIGQVEGHEGEILKNPLCCERTIKRTRN